MQNTHAAVLMTQLTQLTSAVTHQSVSATRFDRSRAASLLSEVPEVECD